MKFAVVAGIVLGVAAHAPYCRSEEPPEKKEESSAQQQEKQEREIRSALDKLRAECVRHQKCVERRDEVAAVAKKAEQRLEDLEEERQILRENPRINSNRIDSLIRRMEQIKRDEVTPCREKLDKEEEKVSKQVQAVEAVMGKVEAFGEPALPVIDEYLADRERNQAMSLQLQEVRDAIDPPRRREDPRDDVRPRRRR